jgi:hypothetical protein
MLFGLYILKNHKYNDDMKRRNYQRGAVDGGMIAMILMGVVIVIMFGLCIWLYMQYSEQKSNVDTKIEAAKALASKEQSEKEAKIFAQREKEPNRQFVGPDDYGRVEFSYPKTWSLYVGSTASTGGGAFKAYLNPGFVPAVSTNERYALRVVIEQVAYEKAVAQYESLVKKGDLKSSQFSTNGQAGTRLDGNFSKDLRGAVVIFKVRDKTVSIFTDADIFKPDFENIIKTIKFNE